MSRKKRPTPTAPDGAPSPQPDDRDATGKSKVSEVDDPMISGDSGKSRARDGGGDAEVSEAGQVARKPDGVDLLN